MTPDYLNRNRAAWAGWAAEYVEPGTQLMLCVPDADGVAAGDRLLRPYFGMHR
jgi:hypothetical protein